MSRANVKVMPAESNDEPCAVNPESTREEVLIIIVLELFGAYLKLGSIYIISGTLRLYALRRTGREIRFLEAFF